jgi:AraC family transcriptional regulator
MQSERQPTEAEQQEQPEQPHRVTAQESPRTPERLPSCGAIPKPLPSPSPPGCAASEPGDPAAGPIAQDPTLSDTRHRWHSYADFYRESAYAKFPQQHRGLAGRLPFRMIDVDQSDHDFTDPDVPESVLALPLAASAHNRWSWDMGSGWRHASAAPGSLLILPAGVESRWRVKGQRKLLLLTLPSTTLEGVLDSALPENLARTFHSLTQAPWEDAFIAQTMVRLWGATLAHDPTDLLLADGALVALATHLLQRAGAGEKPGRRVAMPAWRLQRVIEFVDAHLHEDLGIAVLADAAGLSVRHFTRAFTQQVGETPHRWLMNRRIDKAKQRLAHSDDTLEQVARACGFNAQSHFTRVFRLITGEPPKRWQQQHKRS